MNNMMTQLMHTKFLPFTITCILLLYIGTGFLKKYNRNIPEQFIPLCTIAMSTIATIIWCYTGAYQISPQFYIEEGITNGMAAVGLHQVIKQLKQYYNIRKYKKNPGLDKRKRDRKIS